MGFFSKLFNLDGKENKLANEPKSREFTLDAQTAAKILSEIDIDTAISAHENWKLRLRNYLDGKSVENLDPEIVCQDDKCDLGKWLHGAGRERLGSYPAFSILVARHKYFHVQASTVVALTQAGDKPKAEELLQKGYLHGSTQTVMLLKELKRELNAA